MSERHANPHPDFSYSDGIAAARTMVALQADAEALQRRLPVDWALAPYTGDDFRGKALRNANLLIPFHEVYAVRLRNGKHRGLAQVSYVAFVSQARNRKTDVLAHIHWLTYTEDPQSVPGKYGDGKLAQIKRSETFTKERRGETRVREEFSAVGESGEIHLSLSYLGDHFKSGQRLSVQNRPTEVARAGLSCSTPPAPAKASRFWCASFADHT